MDVISVVGIKIVFLGNSVAVNRKDIVTSNLDTNVKQISIFEHPQHEAMFSRSPRTVEPLYDEVIEVEGPPSSQKRREQPLLFVLGPSVTMPIPILMSTFINSQINNSSRSMIGMIASVGMSAIVEAGWAMAHYKYNKKVLAEDEAHRTTAYQEYIRKNELLIKDKQNYDN